VSRRVSFFVYCGFALYAFCAAPGVSLAEDGVPAAEPAAPASPWREFAVGAIATPHSWLAYSSATIAPFGATGRDGVRLRLGSGYGKYEYVTLPATHAPCPDPTCRQVAIKGRVTFADILAGYQFGYGQFTAKAFAGFAFDSQSLTPEDTGNDSRGRAAGFKVVVETWTNITPTIWLSLDGSWTNAHNVHSAQARLGYRLLPQLSLGLEAGALGNVAKDGDQFRAGVFTRYEWTGGEVVLAGGLSDQFNGSYKAPKDNIWSSLNVIFRF
jgi:hypothetical protein